MSAQTQKCLRCHADTQTRLCHTCTTRTRNTLRGLPRLLRHLHEAAVGQTRLGDIGRHTPYRSRHELHGDTPLATHIEPLPPRDQWDKPVTYTDDDPDPDPATDPADLYESRQARQQTALRKLLAAGGINERASTLHATILDALTTWINDLAETHQLNTSMIGSPADMCLWLAHHIRHLANHPAANELTDELEHHTRAILRILNRPTPPRYLGPCPQPLTTDHDENCNKPHPHPCGTALQAHHKATTTTCTNCGTQHNDLNEIARQAIETADDQWANQHELIMFMAALGTPITDTRLRQWRRRRTIRHRTLPDGTPQYHLGDARTMAARDSLSQNSFAVAIPKNPAKH